MRRFPRARRFAPILPALLIALGSVSAAPPTDPLPVQLGETRPLETALGDPSLPAAREVWVEMLRGARRSVDLEHFYLSRRAGEALDPVLDEIGRAARRGVRVRLLLDASMHRTYPQPADSQIGRASCRERV